jgi:hypothetical protein
VRNAHYFFKSSALLFHQSALAPSSSALAFEGLLRGAPNPPKKTQKNAVRPSQNRQIHALPHRDPPKSKKSKKRKSKPIKRSRSASACLALAQASRWRRADSYWRCF